MDKVDKIYHTYQYGQSHSTFSSFAEAVKQVYNWDMPAIVCEEDGDVAFRVFKQGEDWHQAYPDGREREVSARMATIYKTKIRRTA